MRRPPGTFLLPILIAATIFCGVEREEQPAAAPTLEPAPAPTRLSNVAPITREEATDVALGHIRNGWLDRIPPVTDFRAVTTRLIPGGQIEGFEASGWFSGPSIGHGATGPEDPVWVVQVRGDSTYTTPNGVAQDFRYAIEAVNPRTRSSVWSARTVSEPFLIWPEYNPGAAPELDVVDPFTETAISREQAIGIMIEHYDAESPRSYYLPNRIETELVRLQGGRLAWWVFLPSELSFHGCGPAPVDDRYTTCWPQMVYEFIDAATGEVTPGSGYGKVGSRVTNAEYAALTRFAYAEGWWELFHRLAPYGGQPIPSGLAAELDRPDAPTPTPPPPTPTPDPNEPPTPTPTPPPPAPTPDPNEPPTPTPTPPPPTPTPPPPATATAAPAEALRHAVE